MPPKLHATAGPTGTPPPPVYTEAAVLQPERPYEGTLIGYLEPVTVGIAVVFVLVALYLFYSPSVWKRLV